MSRKLTYLLSLIVLSLIVFLGVSGILKTDEPYLSLMATVIAVHLVLDKLLKE